MRAKTQQAGKRGPTTHTAPKHYPIRAALVAIATITIMVFGGISEMMKQHTGDTMSTEQLIPQIPLWCSSALKPITGTDRTKAAEMFRDWTLEKQETNRKQRYWAANVLPHCAITALQLHQYLKSRRAG